MILYGIKNCDTVKKAQRWCEANNVDFTFHDFRVAGLDEATIQGWLSAVSWEDLLNKRSTSWRQLEDAQKENLDQAAAIALMLANPTLIKRPVLCDDAGCMVGFNAETYQKRCL